MSILAPVRRALLVLAVTLALPAGAGALPTPTLTLKAPKATMYLHRIEFVGRLAPATPDARIRLMRGSTLVAVGRVRGDGTFRIPVQLANPGPFHVAWAGAMSDEVTVRIRPQLDTQLVGSGVVGAPLHLVAELQPSAAGSVRVQVIRGGQVGYDMRFPGSARVSLGTAQMGQLRVRVTTVPKPGYDPPNARELTATLRPQLLSLGTTNPAVSEVARRLSALHYAIPSLSSSFGDDFQESVWAFQKVQGLDRTGVVDAAFWTRLESPRIPLARYQEPADHIEVDKTRQVLYLVRGGQIAMISPAATAGIAGYYTPEGRFAIYRKVTGWDHEPARRPVEPDVLRRRLRHPRRRPGAALPGLARMRPGAGLRDLPAVRLEPYGETVYVYS